MYTRYFVDIGEWTKDSYGKGMNVYSKVQIDDEEGDGNDKWICDSFNQKIGSGHGFGLRVRFYTRSPLDGSESLRG